MGGSQGGKKAASSVAAASTADSGTDSIQSLMGAIEKIKSFSLVMTVNIPSKDKDKHKNSN
jgi:hypothetical protein